MQQSSVPCLRLCLTPASAGSPLVYLDARVPRSPLVLLRRIIHPRTLYIKPSLGIKTSTVTKMLSTAPHILSLAIRESCYSGAFLSVLLIGLRMQVIKSFSPVMAHSLLLDLLFPPCTPPAHLLGILLPIFRHTLHPHAFLVREERINLYSRSPCPEHIPNVDYDRCKACCSKHELEYVALSS